MEALQLGLKRQRREADNSPPSTADVNKEPVELYLLSPIRLHAAVIKYKDNSNYNLSL
jgi:hypothetical protein